MKRRHPFGGAYAFVGLFTSESYNQMPPRTKSDLVAYNKALWHLDLCADKGLEH